MKKGEEDNSFILIFGAFETIDFSMDIKKFNQKDYQKFFHFIRRSIHVSSVCKRGQSETEVDGISEL